jgi:hypothetical protein
MIYKIDYKRQMLNVIKYSCPELTAKAIVFRNEDNCKNVKCF